MAEEICETCGYKSLLGAVEKYCAIPNEITEAPGMPESQTLKMCCNCRGELETWYSAKVAKMFYEWLGLTNILLTCIAALNVAMCIALWRNLYSRKS